MTLFDRAFNHATLASIGIRLPPKEEQALITHLFHVLQDRLWQEVNTRVGRAVARDPTSQALIQAYFPDYQGVLQTECMKLFQEVEQGKWR